MREPSTVTAADPDTSITMALALLSRGLAGAIDVSGFDHLPASAAPLAPPTAATPPSRPTSAVASQPATSSTVRSPALAAPTEAPTAAPPVGPAPGAQTDQAATASNATVLVQNLAAVVSMSAPAAERLRILQDDVIGDCNRCKLHRGRNRLVYGVGNPEADLIFVGDAPGDDEDRQGLPLMGPAGQLFTNMITAMGRDRYRDVYVCNVVKCRPPNNRPPEHDEVAACVGFLNTQFAIVQPKVIVGLGDHACRALLKTSTTIEKLRGRWHKYQGIDFMPTFAPEFLEKQPTRKREAWNDLKLVMERLASR